MIKLKGLLLTEGMHGMISQVEGLAKALDLDFIHEKIELNNFWKLFPPKITPVQDFVFKNKINSPFEVVISCGRKSVIPSIYLKKKFKNKIINIHPALLPKYGGKGMYGKHVHQAVKDSGDSHTGITIHYVNENYDEGGIIFQAQVGIDSNDDPDSIAQKIHKLEHKHFPEVINQILNK